MTEQVGRARVDVLGSPFAVDEPPEGGDAIADEQIGPREQGGRHGQRGKHVVVQQPLDLLPVVAESVVALRREDELAAANALVLRRVDVVEVRLSAFEGGTPGIVAGRVARHGPDSADADLGGGDTRLVDRRILLRAGLRDTQQ